MSQPLLHPYQLGSLALPNRIVMAPMTRCRADNPETAATELIAEYYAQRADAGLLISEGTFVSAQAVGFINVPGIYSPAQVRGWRVVTDRVHRAGGRIFAQLWHVGAVSHPDLLGGATPVAPSAVNPQTNAFTPAGFKPTVTPRALETAEIGAVIAEFRRAAANAMEAGFDGVELHGANGYLIHQFLARSMNGRTDAYGGSIANRLRFLLELLDAVAREVPADRIGLRINPAMHGLSGILFDDETLATFEALARALDDRGLAYLHVMEPIGDTAGLPARLVHPSVAACFRGLYRGTLLGAVDYTQDSANAAISSGTVDLVAFGRAFIANPDLVSRFREHLPLAAAVRETFYAGGARGYVDYPPYDAASAPVDAANRVAPGERYGETRTRSRATAEE